jgi:hypothetical protein
MAKIRLKIKRSEKTKKSEIKKRDIGQLNKEDIKEEFMREVKANVQNTQLEVEVMNELWNRIKKNK